jgi:hypothetical protein
MIMTLTEAKAYVAAVVGGANSAGDLALAGRAITAAYMDFQKEWFWNFLLKDTARGFSVSGCTLAASTTVTAVTTGQYDGVNKGVTVTVTGTGNGAVPANTTVTDYHRDANGNIDTLTLSAAATAGTVGANTLTFSGNIPIISGTEEYNPPPDFASPKHARLLSLKWPLTYTPYAEWNMITRDHTISLPSGRYTLYNPDSESTQKFSRLRLLPPPSMNDTLFMQYYRAFDPTRSSLDIPDEYVFNLLDYAQWRMLKLKNAGDERIPEYRNAALKALADAVSNDQEQAEDEDICMRSQMDIWNETPSWPLLPSSI